MAVLGGAAMAWPLAVRAQQSERMRRIGVLNPIPADHQEAPARTAAFQQGLQQLGWTVGLNVRIDYRWSGGDAGNIRKHAAELVALAPDVILASGVAALGPLMEATRTVPIVFPLAADPVGAGFVAGGDGSGGHPRSCHTCWDGNPPTCRFCRRPSSSWSSNSKRRGCSALRCRTRPRRRRDRMSAELVRRDFIRRRLEVLICSITGFHSACSVSVRGRDGRGLWPRTWSSRYRNAVGTTHGRRAGDLPRRKREACPDTTRGFPSRRPN